MICRIRIDGTMGSTVARGIVQLFVTYTEKSMICLNNNRQSVAELRNWRRKQQSSLFLHLLTGWLFSRKLASLKVHTLSQKRELKFASC